MTIEQPTRTPPRPESRRGWPLVLLALFLGAQALLLVALGYLLLSPPPVAHLLWLPLTGEIVPLNRAVGGLGCGLAFLGLVTAFRCFFSPGKAVWRSTMLIQGIVLLVTLFLYFFEGRALLEAGSGYPYGLYAMQVNAIAMVAYLQVVVRPHLFGPTPSPRSDAQ
ncbi:MAG: hypothetical protein JXB35_14225 [Anaerolineae bacterium]|nr:hypothetical protein [Anaerolineae bacterium]